jgi:DNA-binding response OmpR family regulator
MIRHVCRCRHCGALEVEGLELDTQRNIVHWRGAETRVEPNEMRLLARLVQADGRVVSMEMAQHAVWGHRRDGGPVTAENAVKVYVSRIRARLREIGAPIEIVTQWGHGFTVERIEAGEAFEHTPVASPAGSPRRAMVDG